MDGAPTNTNSGEERARRRGATGRWGPWAVSAIVHGVLALAATLVTWTVSALRDEPPAPVIVADFTQTTYAPLAESAESTADAADAAPPTPEVPPAVPLPEAAAVPDAASMPDLDLIGAPSAPVPVGAAPIAAAAAPIAARADFAGLSTSNARRIVYVIDASGSMIRTLPIVLDELERSLVRLDPEQSFALVFFQADRAVVGPPRRLVEASDRTIERALDWARTEVIAEGRSNPLTALRTAIGMKPDAIFLLSENITGAGEFEIDPETLLARLDELNPRDPETGRRPVTIGCIQFLDEDPLGTLERIAAEHGGERGYKFLDRAELGLVSP